MAGWIKNSVYEEVAITDIPSTNLIYRLGEMYSYKRSGSAKHRVIMYGNHLKKMVDCFYTVSNTLSYDGLRIFTAISAIF
jgi:hypothetical protein